MIEPISFFQWLKGIWGCGRFYRDKRSGAYSLRISSQVDLIQKVIPTFETYDLRAKKQRQFEAWKILVYTWFFRKPDFTIQDLINLREGLLPKGRCRVYRATEPEAEEGFAL